MKKYTITNIPNFNKYPPSVQSFFNKWLCDIVRETFVLPADYDYLNARWLSINQMYRPFFWSAEQAIEKYLKANLLFLGKSVRNYNHNIVKMAKDMESKTCFLKETRLMPRKEYEVLLDNNLWGSENIYDFLKSIEKYGSPHNRYDFYGSDYKFSYLLKLDHLIYVLRANVINTKPFYKIRNLDKLSYYAYEQNYYFAPSNYKHQSIYNGFISGGMDVPTIEVSLKGRLGYQQVFEKWLKENIKINDNQIEEIKNS